MKKMKKRFITLIEIMIVMFLIALITGALAYRFSGALEKGYAFKTKANMERLDAILNLAIAEDPSLLTDISSKWPGIVESSPLVKDPKSLERDGWGDLFDVSAPEGQIQINSKKYEDYLQKNPGAGGR